MRTPTFEAADNACRYTPQRSAGRIWLLSKVMKQERVLAGKENPQADQ